jgi:signal transduction histidine kinase
MRWTVRNKFLMVMSGLLITCLGVYLLMAITVFKSDKTQLVFDLNRSQAANLIGEIETRLAGASEKLKLFALLPTHLQDRMADDLFSEGSDIVSAAIFKADQSTPLRSFSQHKFLETYGLDENFFSEQTKSSKKIPFEAIRHRGEALWNASTENGPPLLGFGRLVVLQDSAGHSADYWIVVGFVELDHFLKSMSVTHLNDIVVVNAEGDVLISPKAALMTGSAKVPDTQLFKEANEANTKVSVFVREVSGERMLVAFAKGFNDQVMVIAKTSEAQVFKVVRDLSVQTFLFGLIVLTIVIIAAFLLSRPLTENIAMLADQMELVSQGDLNGHIDIKGTDETVQLAHSFNQMIRDLRSSRNALVEMNRELDKKVKDRTEQLEIQNQKVKEAQEALLRTTRLASAGEIAGRATHELLNPLTILLARVGLMQKRVSENQGQALGLFDEIRKAWLKDYEDGGFEHLVKNWQSDSKIVPGRNLFQEDVENFAQVSGELRSQSENLSNDILFVKDEAERIGKIVNGMRRLGQFKSDIQEHPLHAILESCHQIMADLFDQKQFSIIKSFEATKDLCLVDRDEVIQAVTNLMRNSLQSMAEVQGREKMQVKISTRNEGENIVVDVEDNGIGIEAKDQNKLFQGSFTTKSRDEGTGLGLGISRRFVRAFGGDLEFVRSTPRQSTIFRIRIPLHSGKIKHGAVA